MLKEYTSKASRGPTGTRGNDGRGKHGVSHIHTHLDNEMVLID